MANLPPDSVKDSLMSMPCLLPHGPLRAGTASVNHFVSTKPGLIGHSKGTLTTKAFKGGAVFVDTKTSVSYVPLQTSLNAAQFIEDK